MSVYFDGELGPERKPKEVENTPSANDQVVVADLMR